MLLLVFLSFLHHALDPRVVVQYYHLILSSPTVSYKPQSPDLQCICNLRKVAVQFFAGFML